MYVTVSEVKRATQDIIKGLNAGEQIRLTREAERQLGMESTYYLAKYINGYRDLNNRFHVALAGHHDRYIMENQLHLHARKHLKTTITTITGNQRLSLINPDIAICIIANTLGNSTSFLKELKSHYIYNDKFRDLYPEHAVKRKKDEGTTEQFTTPARKANWKRSCTFECASVDKAIVSRHYDKLHFDDIVDDKNTTTPELRLKTYDNYATSLATASLVNGMPWHMIIGTRWAFDDMYSKLIDDNLLSPSFRILLTQAERWKVLPDGRRIKQYAFPEKFTPEALKYLRKKMGQYKYSCLFLNDPVPEGTSSLDHNCLVLYNQEERGNVNVNRTITVDPSSAEDTKDGYPTAITVSEMDEYGHLWIREMHRLFQNPDENIHTFLDLCQIYNVRKAGVEKAGLSKIWIYYLEKAMRERGLRIEIEKLTRDSRVSKDDRIERIAPFLNQGRIHVRYNDPELPHLRREMREFPKGHWKDVLDTIADAFEILTPAIGSSSEEPIYWVPPGRYAARTNIQTGYSVYAGPRWAASIDGRTSAPFMPVGRARAG